MDKLFEQLIENKSPEEISNLLVNINRYQLNRKAHIKKYNKLRKLHGEILDSMINNIENGKFPIDKYYQSIATDVERETDEIYFDLDLNDEDDITIITELFVYKNHKKMPSLTELYLEKKIFRNKEKLALLNGMKNSYVGLFKIVDVDRDNGYVVYQDVFTHKRFKIIDISMSSTLKVDKKRPLYMYNRIITVDEISFATGIHCMMTWENKILKEFLKKHKYSRCSDFSRCILLYEISKMEKNLKTSYNHQYGYRR